MGYIFPTPLLLCICTPNRIPVSSSHGKAVSPLGKSVILVIPKVLCDLKERNVLCDKAVFTPWNENE